MVPIPTIAATPKHPKELGQAHLQAEGNHFQEGQGNRFTSCFDVGDEGSINPEVHGHAQLRKLTFSPQFS